MGTDVMEEGGGDLLRLKFCPGCEYSLETLAGEGVCPECGRGYDQRFVVMHGAGRGRRDGLAGGTWRGVAWGAAVLVMYLWFVRQVPGGAAGAQMWVTVICLALVLATQLYARLFSARDPRTQLWVSAEGVAQVLSTPEGRRAQWLTGLTSSLSTPAMMVAIVMMGGLPPGWANGVVVGAVGLGGLICWYQWREGRGLDAADYVPRLWRWGAVERLSVKKVSGGRVRVRCEVTRRWLGMPLSKEWVVDVEVACGEAEGERLGERLLVWARGGGSGVKSV